MGRAIPATMALGALLLAGLAAPPSVTASGALAQAIPAGPLTSGRPTSPLPGPTSSWTTIRAPLPPRAAAKPQVGLSNLACPPTASSACVAAGYYTDSAAGQQVLLLTGHGSSWTAAKAPLPAGADTKPSKGLLDPTTVYTVACPPTAPSACVAAGYYTLSAGTLEQGLLLTGHGSSWTAVKAPLPGSSFFAILYSVACPTATVCVAVGSYGDESAGAPEGLLLTGHGSSWTAARAPLPAGAAAASPGAMLTGVVCPSVTDCVATGDYTDSSGGQQPVLVTGHGSSWTAVKAPLPAGAAAKPAAGIGPGACPSPAECVITGIYADSSGRNQAFILTGHGSSWTAVKAPLPPGAVTSTNLSATSLARVACGSSGDCVATGHYTDSAGRWQALLLTGHGSSWTAVRAPLPAGAAPGGPAILWDVACPSASACLAAGYYTDSAGRQRGLLVTGHGSSWSAVRQMLPAGAAASPKASLGDLACQSVAACVVTGGYTDSTGSSQGLLLTGPA